MTVRSLRGWDAIAAYLQISPRTLQDWRLRYAGTDALPISQPGGRSGLVFARTIAERRAVVRSMRQAGRSDRQHESGSSVSKWCQQRGGA